MSVTNENIYDVILISKIKKRTGPKRLKKINRNLRNLIEDDFKEFSGLKIKKFEEEKVEEEEENQVPKNAVPVIEIKHYIEDFKKPNSREILNNDDELQVENVENTPIIADNNEILKQFNFSDSSADE